MSNKKSISFDTGLQEVVVNDISMFFQPTDPNLYGRFFEFYNGLDELAKRYSDALEQKNGETDENGVPKDVQPALEALKQLDVDIKQQLTAIFGEQNDFDAIFKGVNVMATTKTGATVLENFMLAIMPVIETSADARQKAMKKKAQQAAEQQAANRAQRRAVK